MSGTKPMRAWLIAVPLLLTGGACLVLYQIHQQGEERELDQVAKLAVSLGYGSTSRPLDYAEVRKQVLEATTRALSHANLRERARQTRIDLFVNTLDPVSLQREVEEYLREQQAFSNKDPVFGANIVLYDCWSVPTPESVEHRRLTALGKRGMDFREVEWDRPFLLKRFVEGKKLLAAGNLSGAEAAFDETLAVAPEFAQAWYLRGRARFGMRKHSSALGDFMESVRLDPSRPEAYRWAAAASGELGSRDHAIEMLRCALTRDPDYREAREMLDKLGNPR